MSDRRRPVPVARWDELTPREPAAALVAGVDLVVVRFGDDDRVSVLYGRCLHRGALLADGFVRGDDLICGLHDWDYRLDTGISAYANDERLQRFESWVEDGQVWVDEAEVAAWGRANPQPFDRDAYQGAYADVHGAPEEPHVRLIQALAKDGLDEFGHHGPSGAPEEPHVRLIQALAKDGLDEFGHHGPSGAMGVPRQDVPGWDDLQVVTAQMARKPLLDDHPVGRELVLGPRAARPLRLEIPLFVSDMSFGALSREAKLALASGAEQAGTGICSGEGGMLPAEQEANGRYLYELASGRFGWSLDKVARCQAFHFKGGQGAKTGTGGHLPGHKVSAEIAEVRGLEPGQAAISPATFTDLVTADDFRALGDEVRAATGGIPIGFKLSAQHVEADLDFALEAGADYVILDGRGGGTGSAPLIFRDHISVPTLPALARARAHLDAADAGDVTLIVTGGLRTPADYAKALMLGADGVALSNAVLQAAGCLGMRACHTNNCPVGIATQKPHLRERLVVEQSAARVARFLRAATDLMAVLARACGHDHLSGFTRDDLVTWKSEIARLTGVRYAGVGTP